MAKIKKSGRRPINKVYENVLLKPINHSAAMVTGYQYEYIGNKYDPDIIGIDSACKALALNIKQRSYFLSNKKLCDSEKQIQLKRLQQDRMENYEYIYVTLEKNSPGRRRHLRQLISREIELVLSHKNVPADLLKFSEEILSRNRLDKAQRKTVSKKEQVPRNSSKASEVSLSSSDNLQPQKNKMSLKRCPLCGEKVGKEFLKRHQLTVCPKRWGK